MLPDDARCLCIKLWHPPTKLWALHSVPQFRFIPCYCCLPLSSLTLDHSDSWTCFATDSRRTTYIFAYILHTVLRSSSPPLKVLSAGQLLQGASSEPSSSGFDHGAACAPCSTSLLPTSPASAKWALAHNKKIDFDAKGFLAVMDSVHLLKKLKFDSIFVDEAHHPLPPKMPGSMELYRLSATHKEEPDFRYTMGQAIEDGILCDYDITVPALTAHHAYVCLGDLLLKQARDVSGVCWPTAILLLKRNAFGWC